MSQGRLAENLEKARQHQKSNRSRLVASACLLGVAIASSGCAEDTHGILPPPVQHGSGSGGGGGGGGTG
jgi:hypothetical protein